MRLGRHPLDMASIRSIRIFIAVAESQSFTAAAKQLHLAISTVSKSIAALEASLELPLLYRNTRRVSVTEAGEFFYRRCRVIMAEINEASAGGAVSRPIARGHLRVVASPSFSATVLSPTLPIFLNQYPNITIDLLVNSAMPNLVQDGIDVAIMLRDHPETKTASLRLAPNPRVFCATPRYLKAKGVPATPQDLEYHSCLVSLLSGVQDRWMIRDGEKTRALQIASAFASNDGNVLKSLCLDGFGIASLYRFHAHEELRKGSLVELFPELQPNTNSVYAIFPHREMIEHHTQVFVDFVRETIGDPPYWA